MEPIKFCKDCPGDNAGLEDLCRTTMASLLAIQHTAWVEHERRMETFKRLTGKEPEHIGISNERDAKTHQEFDLFTRLR